MGGDVNGVPTTVITGHNLLRLFNDGDLQWQWSKRGLHGGETVGHDNIKAIYLLEATTVKYSSFEFSSVSHDAKN